MPSCALTLCSVCMCTPEYHPCHSDECSFLHWEGAGLSHSSWTKAGSLEMSCPAVCVLFAQLLLVKENRDPIFSMHQQLHVDGGCLLPADTVDHAHLFHMPKMHKFYLQDRVLSSSRKLGAVSTVLCGRYARWNLVLWTTHT